MTADRRRRRPRSSPHRRRPAPDVAPLRRRRACLLTAPVAARPGGGRRSWRGRRRTTAAPVGSSRPAVVVAWAVAGVDRSGCGGATPARRRSSLAGAIVGGVGSPGARRRRAPRARRHRRIVLGPGLRLSRLRSLPAIALHLLLGAARRPRSPRPRAGALVVAGYVVAARRRAGVAGRSATDRRAGRSLVLWAAALGSALHAGQRPLPRRPVPSTSGACSGSAGRSPWPPRSALVVRRPAPARPTGRDHAGAVAARPPPVSSRWRSPPARCPAASARVDRLLTHTVVAHRADGAGRRRLPRRRLGLGRTPDRRRARRCCCCRWSPPASRALLYLPARRRLTERANRLVYGERVSPDEALRTFGSRLTRAIPMDELLLQLAESAAQVDDPAPRRDLDGHRTAATSSPPWCPHRERRAVRDRRQGARGRHPGRRVAAARGSTSGCPAIARRRGTERHARRADRPRRRAARASSWSTRRRRRRGVHRGGRPGAHRARPPGRPGAAQRAARHRAAGQPRRAARAQRGAAGSRAPASSPPATPSGASSSATCTTAPSSTSWRWP